jgi:glycosyltransferase involved in cell wall biosynthesis
MSLKISVLTPSYNSALYLERAINSVLNQNYDNWEHVIYDADSKDGTKEILEKHKHLIWVSEPDKGQSDAMNKAFNKSTGDIIVYLNADDYFEPNAFSSIIETFNEFGDVDVVVGKMYTCLSVEDKTYVTDASIAINDFLRFWKPEAFPNNPVCYFYKRKVQDTVGDFPQNNHYVMDYWFLLRAAIQFKFIKIDAILGTFVIGDDNKSADLTRAYIELYKETQGFMNLHPILLLDNPNWALESITHFISESQEYKKMYVKTSKELETLYNTRTFQNYIKLLSILKRIKSIFA